MESRKEKEFNQGELQLKVAKASADDQVQIKAAFQKIVNAIKEVHLG
jgi:hypothetical protein